MTDRIDTAKEREWLGRLFLTIAKVEHSHACDGGYSIVGSAAAAAIERVLSPRLTAFLDALDAKDAENERLREALGGILNIPNSDAAPGIMKCFARAALNPEGET